MSWWKNDGGWRRSKADPGRYRRQRENRMVHGVWSRSANEGGLRKKGNVFSLFYSLAASYFLDAVGGDGDLTIGRSDRA